MAIAAAYVSYRHGHEFALRFGADETTATLWPLIVDGLLTMATIELWKTSHHAPTKQWKAWLSFALGIGLSLVANIASAPQLNAFSIAVAACPPLALLLSVELLNQALKRRHTETTRTRSHQLHGQPSTQPNSANAGKENQTLETPDHADNAPAMRTGTNNITGHSISSADTGLGPPPDSEDDDPLREQAYRLDAEHWNLHQRPISAETLRRKLRVGSTRARTLTHQIRQHRQPGVLAAAE